MARLPDLEAWAIFAKVVQAGSFAAAADQLQLSKPTVSKAITRLEERLRAPLLQRTTRQLTLTETGRSALEHARRLLAEGEAAEAEAVAQVLRPYGLVRMTAPMSFGQQQLAPLLPAFLAAYPDVSIDLRLSDEQEDLVGKGYDVALRIAALADSSLMARQLCGVARPIVASPAYLAQHGRPQHPAELMQHSAIHYSNVANPGTWRLEHADGETWEGRVPGRLTINNADFVVPTLLAGLGIAIQPIFSVWREIEDGRLEVVLPGWSQTPINLYLVTPPNRLRPARVKVLMEFLAQHLSSPVWAIRAADPPL
ncbi:LysR family transcriptional regulator [Sandarakinorhabdus oryzae]|uniref:LysR family transcriptional regulator n=1 Tax=Sandarakinorhabdus oryzae TaxID=2675220 RepID=UPI0012E0EDBF|nr:LysR family transcriptional regulator [Sandarakinorhabdus oryzae]